AADLPAPAALVGEGVELRERIAEGRAAVALAPAELRGEVVLAELVLGGASLRDLLAFGRLGAFTLGGLRPLLAFALRALRDRAVAAAASGVSALGARRLRGAIDLRQALGGEQDD